MGERNNKNCKLTKMDTYNFCSDSVLKKSIAYYREQKVWVARKGLFKEVTFNSKLER